MNAWKQCFSSATKNIGKSGFKSLGFHERKAMSHEDESVSKMRAVITLEHVQRQQEQKKVMFPIPKVAHQQQTATQKHPRKRVRRRQVELGNGLYWYEQLSRIHMPSNKLRNLEQGQTKTLNSLMNYPEGGGALMQKFSKVMNNYYSDYEVQLLQEASSERGVFLVSPALYYMLSSTQLKTDPRFADDLLCPPPEQQLFFPHRKIGTYVVDYSTWRVKECDLLARDVLQRDLVGLHAFEFAESPMEILIAFVKCFPLLQEKGTTWCRIRAIKGDGKRVGLLYKIRLLDRLSGLVQFQEQNHVHGEMLDTPLLL